MAVKLPPLNGLRAFEVSARHLSFTRAAQELFVTQAAVSQQVKHLEEYLGFKLFYRLTRKLELTHEGMQLSSIVTRSLEDISHCIQELQRDEVGGALTLSAPPLYAMSHLIPRLSEFQRRYPDIRLHLSLSSPHVQPEVGRLMYVLVCLIGIRPRFM